MVPADGPDGIGGGIRIAGEAAGAGDLGELVAPDDGPRVGFAVPFGESAAGDIGVCARERGVLAVVGVDEHALAGIETLAVVAGQSRAAERFLHLFIAEQFRHGEGVDIDLVKALLHGGRVNLVGGIGEMAGIAGGAAEHGRKRNRADLALGVDGVGADEELLGFAVNEAVGGSAADALGVDRLAQGGVDGVEFVVGAAGLVRRVSDDPEFIGPRDDGAGAAFALRVPHREVRVDPAEGGRRRHGCGGGENGGEGEGKQAAHGNDRGVR